MTELIEKVKEAKKLLKDSQKELLTWCRDKNGAPLDERFSVWSKYVDKDRQSYCGCRDSKILSDLIDVFIDTQDIERHRTVSWDWLHESLIDIYISGNKAGSWAEKAKRKILDTLNKHKQLVRDAKIDAILSPVESKEGQKYSEGKFFPVKIYPTTWLGMAIPSEDEFSNLISEEIMVANFGSFEHDW